MTKHPAWDGMKAREKGLDIEICPYPPSVHRTAWVIGWYIATEREPGSGQKNGPALLPSQFDREETP